MKAIAVSLIVAAVVARTARGQTAEMADGAHQATHSVSSSGGTVVSQTVASMRAYSFYTPELQLLAETDLTDAASPAISDDYVWFGGMPVAQISSSGAVAYYFDDHLGAPVLQTDEAGVAIWRAERDPYGDRYALRAGAGRHQPLGLPGQEMSENAPDIQYNIFRWYRRSWGRYSQTDPIGLHYDRDDANIDRGAKLFNGRASLNLFAYAGDSPTRYIDRDGLSFFSKCLCGAAPPEPSTSPVCDAYGNSTYTPPGFATVSQKCFCKCAGDSAWSQQVRGCLACAFKNGINPTLSHSACYYIAGPVMPGGLLLDCDEKCKVGFGGVPRP